jgi:LPXTG-motif cell wall-anchored protein
MGKTKGRIYFMITTKQNWFKRSLSLLLALVMCVSMVSVTAFAEGNDAEQTATAETSAAKAKYLEQLEAAKALPESDYSASSYEIFQKRLAEYDRTAILNDDYEIYTDYEYKKLTEGIETAKNVLRDPSHSYYQEFVELINYCENLNPDDYTEESYATFLTNYEKYKKRNGLERAKGYADSGNDTQIYSLISNYKVYLNKLVRKDYAETIKIDEATGMRLVTENGAIPENSIFVVDKFDASNWDWQNVNSNYLTNIETVCSQYEYYSFTVYNSDGKSIEFTKPFSIELPVPDYFNMDNLTVSLYKNSCAAGAIGDITIDKENRTVTVKFNILSYLYMSNGASIILKNPIANVDPETFEDGVYQVQADLTKYSDAAEASMSNAALVKDAYLTKSENNIDIYLNFKPIYVASPDTPSFCGGLWCEKGQVKDGDYYSDSQTILSYYTNSDGTIRDNEIYNGVTEIPCVKTIKLHLERDCYNEFGGYTLAVSSPAMAAAFGYKFEDIFIDDLLCNLMISQPVRLGTLEQASSYLPVYDKSALMQKIQYAQIFSAYEYTEESYNALADAIKAAQVVYSAEYTDAAAASDAYEEQIALLNAAVNALEESTELKDAKDSLGAVIEAAKQIEIGDKTESAYTALQEAIASAESVYNNVSSSISNLGTTAETLNAAVEAFNNSEAASTISKNNLADGVYSVYADMIKMDRVSKSMADNAINHTVKLEVIDGEYFVTLDFRGITIENRFGYLKNLSYYADGYTYGQYGTVEGTLVPSEVLSTQKDSDGNDVIDQYNDVNNLYPDIVKIKLVPQAIADEDGYVPLHVFVPIMEAIAAGNGDQDVLMKLDWSTLKATTEEDPDFSPEDPVEQSPAVDVTDDATGVKVHADKGVFEEGVKLVVTPITSGADYNLAASALEEVGKKFKLYEIHFEDANGSEVQPNGTVTVSYPIPEGYDAENVALYRINEDGSKTLIKGTVDGNYYTVITKSFSTFALVEKDSTITDDQNIQNVNNGTFGNNSNNNSDNSSNNNDSNITCSTQDGEVNAPQTGDNSNIALEIMLMFASAGMLAVLTFKRKRRIREGE